MPQEIDSSSPPGASFWIRMAARLIDLFPHYAATVFSLFPSRIILTLYCHFSLKDYFTYWSQINPFNLVSGIFSLIGAFAFHAISEGMHGASAGKLACRISVISADNKHCTMPQALKRSAAYYIDSLFFGAVGYSYMSESSLKQRLGDKWAHTLVCKQTDISPELRRSKWRFIYVFLFAFCIDALIQSLGMILHAL